MFSDQKQPLLSSISLLYTLSNWVLKGDCFAMPINTIPVSHILAGSERDALDAYTAAHRGVDSLPALSAFLSKTFQVELVLDPTIIEGFADDSVAIYIQQPLRNQEIEDAAGEWLDLLTESGCEVDDDALLRETGLDYVAFGHLGDCHLHFTVLPEKHQLEQGVEAYDAIVAKLAELGGVYSGEHGTGKRKRKDFLRCYGADAVQQVKDCKAAVDPEFLLNRENVVKP